MIKEKGAITCGAHSRRVLMMVDGNYERVGERPVRTDVAGAGRWRGEGRYRLRCKRNEEMRLEMSYLPYVTS